MKMLKILLFALACVLVNFALVCVLTNKSFAQAIPQNPNKTNVEGKKEGTWTILYDKDWNVISNTNFVAFYRIITYENGKPKGIVKDFYRSGQVRMEAYLISDNPDVFDSLSTYYSEKGNISYYEFFKQGKYDNEMTIQYLKNLIAQQEKTIDKKQLDGISLNNLANLYEKKGLYAQAEPLYIEAKEIIAKNLGKYHPSYANCLGNLAFLYQYLGLFAKAETFFVESKEINSKLFGTEHPTYVNSLNNLAFLCLANGSYKQSEALAIEAKEISTKFLGKEHPAYAASLKNLGHIYSIQGFHARAELFYVEAKEIWKKVFGKESIEYAYALINLSSTYILQGQYAKAEQVFIEAKGIVETWYKEDANYMYSRFMMDIYKRQGLYAQAKPFFSQIISIDIKTISSLFPILSESEKEDFYNNNIKSNFQDFNAFVLQVHSQFPELRSEMYNLQLASKALLLNSTAKWKQRIVGSGDRKLMGLFDDWEQKRQAFAKFSQLSIEEQKKQGVKLDSLEAQINGLEKVLSQRSELFASLADRKQYTWKDVQAKLKQGEAAIEIIKVNKYGVQKVVKDSSAVDKDSVYTYPKYPLYGLTDTIYYAALIVTPQTKTHPELVLLTNGNELENKYIKIYKNSMKFSVEEKVCYQQFWQKISQKLNSLQGKTPSPSGRAGVGLKRIYFSPDGVYHQINLNTLKNPQTGKYVIDELDIVPVTNTKDLIVQKKEESANTYALLFGNPDYQLGETEREKKAKELEANAVKSSYTLSLERGSYSVSPLPNTKIEVENISELLQAKGYTPQVYLGDEALEENIKNSFKPSILHIATHGFFEPETPLSSGEGTRGGAVSATKNPLLRSGLMLAGAGHSLANQRTLTVEEVTSGKERVDDGILTAYEAMNLNLDNTELVVLSACETGLGDVMNGEGVYGLQRAFKVAGAKAILMSLWKVNDQTTQELMTEFYTLWLGGMNKHEAFKKAQLNLRAKYQSPYYWGAFVMVGE